MEKLDSSIRRFLSNSSGGIHSTAGTQTLDTGRQSSDDLKRLMMIQTVNHAICYGNEAVIQSAGG